MAKSRQAVFVKVSQGQMKIAGRIISINEQFIGDYDTVNRLPGIVFLGYKDEIEKASTRIDLQAVQINTEDENLKITVEPTSSNNNKKPKEEPKEEPTEKIIGFTPERLSELKIIKPGEWVKKKKSEFIEVLEEGNIDYSGVKDDRMALYKFLVGILEEL